MKIIPKAWAKGNVLKYQLFQKLFIHGEEALIRVIHAILNSVKRIC